MNQWSGSKNIPFCGGSDGTRCGAVSAAPLSPLVDSTSTQFLSFVSLPSRVTLFLVLESTWGGGCFKNLYKIWFTEIKWATQYKVVPRVPSSNSTSRRQTQNRYCIGVLTWTGITYRGTRQYIHKSWILVWCRCQGHRQTDHTQHQTRRSERLERRVRVRFRESSRIEVIGIP